MKALAKIPKIKNRSGKKAVSILVSDLQMMEEYVSVPKIAQEIIRRSQLIPKTAVTLVLPVNTAILGKETEFLSAQTNHLGVRVAENPITKAIIERLGCPITTTSANLCDETPAYSIDECKKGFEGRKHQPNFYVDGGSLLRTLPSTIIAIYSNGELKVLREGATSSKQILSV